MRARVCFVIAALVAGCAHGESVRLASPPGRDVAVEMRVVRPEGAGPFPALVWLHGCGGLVRRARHADDWTRRLVRLGYVVALPDSFSGRGYPSGICGNGTRVPPEARADDAYAALRHLENRPDVAAGHIGLIGYSHGGWTVHGFAAAIAFYPECAAGAWVRRYRAVAPLLILSGELDDWTPAAPCQRFAEQAQAHAQAVSIIVYPGAYHSFDAYTPVTRVPEARQGRGATIGGDTAAREDSVKQVEAFFARYLR
jgi:dienelactone hydrolase